MAATGASIIQLFNSGTAGHIPALANLIVGELAINYVDGIIYYNNGAAIVALSPIPTVLAATSGTINNVVIGGTTPVAVTGTTITANTQFTGAGTGLTGTAAGLNIGGNAATATNIAAGAASRIPYQTAANTTTFIAAPTTASTYLSWTGSAFAWATVTGAYNPAAVAITGGSIDGTTIGATTKSTGAFTSLSATSNANINGVSLGTSSGVQANFQVGAGFQGYSSNTALGVSALLLTGLNNTAIGYYAVSNATGSNNTGVGYYVLQQNSTGSNNTALGFQAGYTATSGNANTTGANNTWVGYAAGPGTATQLSNAIAIGSGALNTASNQIVLGNSSSTALVYSALIDSPAAIPTIASTSTIAPVSAIVFVSGTAAIATITAPAAILHSVQITVIPTGAFTTTTAGNIAIASTAVLNKSLVFTYDVTSAKWYPSY